MHLPFAHTKYLCMQNMLQLDKDVSVEMSVKMIEKQTSCPALLFMLVSGGWVGELLL